MNPTKTTPAEAGSVWIGECLRHSAREMNADTRENTIAEMADEVLLGETCDALSAMVACYVLRKESRYDL